MVVNESEALKRRVVLCCTDTARSTKWSTLSRAASHRPRQRRGHGRYSRELWRAPSVSRWQCVDVSAIAAAATASSAERPAGTPPRRPAAADAGRWRQLAASAAATPTASLALSSSEMHRLHLTRCRIISRTYTNDTRTRNRRRKPVPEYRYHKPARK